MSNAIGRLRIAGISKQANFGTASSTVDYLIPMDEAFLIEPIVNKAENNAGVGSGYEVLDTQNTIRYAQFPLAFRVNEDLLPLFFTQKFSVNTVDNLDDTYTHTMSYENETQNYFSVFMQDDQRTDYIMQDVLFDGLNLTAEANNHVMMAGTGVGKFPASGDYTVSVARPRTFVGRHTTFLADDFGGTVTNVSLETLNLNHTFNLSGEDRNFDLGDQDLAFHEIAQDRYELEFTGKLSDRSDYDIFVADTERVARAVITDTNRTIGTASTNPSIQFDYAIAKPIAYTDEGDLDSHLTFNSTYLAVDTPGITGAPAKITVTNTVSSY